MSTPKRSSLALSAAIAAVFAASTALGATLAASDQKFVSTASEAGSAEVDMGKIAVARASSPDVKTFAEQMVADHTKAGEQLRSIASSKNASVQDQPSSKDQAVVDKLNTLSGPEFDRAYVRSQLSAHKDAVALFKKESQSGRDGDLKQFATTTLPTLEHHLHMVEQLSKSPSKTSRVSGSHRPS